MALVDVVGLWQEVDRRAGGHLGHLEQLDRRAAGPARKEDEVLLTNLQDHMG